MGMPQAATPEMRAEMKTQAGWALVQVRDAARTHAKKLPCLVEVFFGRGELGRGWVQGWFRGEGGGEEEDHGGALEGKLHDRSITGMTPPWQ